MMLGRAITLIESNRREHQTMAQQVLTRLLEFTGSSHRVGITGVPGVGKSTFIDALGVSLIEQGHRVAVLTVDPTSSVRGGSILGDKTRMGELAALDDAFIRPSPTQGSLGGVHRKTRESIRILEAAGFDTVLVETVGVGQSETRVADMVDTYLVLMLAGAGDELQGIKKGILEVADILAINKADGENVTRAEAARRDYKSALHVFGNHAPHWKVPVLTCSALGGDGIETVWQTVEEHRSACQEAGAFEQRRRRQRLSWMWAMVEDELISRLRGSPAVRTLVPKLEARVLDDKTTPTAAALEILETFESASSSD